MDLLDRRKHPRWPVLQSAQIEWNSRRIAAFCVDIGPAGAYLSCKDQPPAGSQVEVALRLPGPKTPTVTVLAKVVYCQPPGSSRPAGFAVTWQSARSGMGAEPLHRVLTDVLRLEPSPQLGNDSRGYFYDFTPGVPKPPITPDPPRSVGHARRPQTSATAAALLGDWNPSPSRALMDATTYPPAALNPGSLASTRTPSPTATPMTPPSSESAWPAGVPRLLAERYGDFALLGQGGNGVIYRAHDRLRDQHVVIKFMVPGADSQEIARRYFLRELRVSSTLLHQNIVRLYEVGVADEQLYYTMELLEGHNLSTLLAHGRTIDDPRFLHSVFGQLGDALDYAHQRKVLHRDIKPANVVIQPDGVVKLLDFGLARVLEDGFADQSLVVGTPHYMAPEQATRGRIDHRADLYAMGVLLFRMVAGRLPFTEGDILMAHATLPVPDPQSFNPQVSDAVAEVVNWLMAKSPDDRPHSAGLATSALGRALFGAD